MTDHTDKEVYAFLIDRFQPIYADLVVSLGEKPTQVVFQLEAAFVHIAAAHKYQEKYQEKYQDNINKAYGHLQCATLDAVKILWHLHKIKLERLIDDASLRKYCFNCSETAILELYRQTEALARKARNLEIQSAGVGSEISVTAYYDAVMKLREVLELVDYDKVRSFNRSRIQHRYVEYTIGFVLGVFASVVASIITNSF